MKKGIAMKLFIVATILLVSCLPAQAQTQAEADQLAKVLTNATSQLAKDNMTLSWMEREQPLPQSSYLRTVNDGASGAITEFRHLATLAEIYSLMTSPKDRVTAKSFFVSAASRMFQDEIQIDLLKAVTDNIKSASAKNHALNVINQIEVMRTKVNNAIKK